jgi:hypothetical protein
MVRNLGELPNFLVFNFGTGSLGTIPFSLFPYCCSLYTEFCILLSGYDQFGVSNVFAIMFQMNMRDYPHVTITKDGRLCSMGQHRPGFPRMLYDTLLHLGYNRDVSVYRARMSMAHGLDQCEVSVTIPHIPAEPWMATIIGVEQMVQIALTSLCGSHLTDTAAMPIALFPLTTRETSCSSNTLRLYLTPRARTSMQEWLRWPSMHNTRSTCST